MVEMRAGKQCSMCRRWKPFDPEFSLDRKNKDGYASACKDCHEKVNRAWRKNRPHYDALRALKKRLPPGTPTYTEAEIMDLCEKYGNRCLRCRRDAKLYADHVDPKGPHTIDNIQPLCRRCNNTKHNSKQNQAEDFRPKSEVTADE